MYLSDKERAEIRDCIKKHLSSHKKNESKNNSGLHETKEIRTISQILFDARDGKEVFTPFS